MTAMMLAIDDYRVSVLRDSDHLAVLSPTGSKICASDWLETAVRKLQ
jgi:hypothetical protein